LEDYFQLEGLAYRVTPIKHDNKGGTGWINIEKMYDNLVNKFQWGNMEKEGVYMGEQVQRMSTNYRNNFARLARELTMRGDTARAIKTLDRCMEIMPPNKIPMQYYSVYLADAYYQAGGADKGNEVMEIIINRYTSELEWYIAQDGIVARRLSGEVEKGLQALKTAEYFLDRNLDILKIRGDNGLEKAEELSKRIKDFEESNKVGINRFLNKVESRSRN